VFENLAPVRNRRKVETHYWEAALSTLGFLLHALTYSAVGICTVLFYCIVYFDRQWAHEISSEFTWKSKMIVFPAMLGTGVCIYCGTVQAMSWIPRSWNYLDYGSASFAEYLGWVIGGNAAFLLPYAALSAASKHLELEQEVRGLWEQIRKLRQPLD